MAFKVIYGPPCSGKSTYARKNMGARDVLFDYDSVSSALTDDNSHTVNDREYAHKFVLDMRSAYVGTAKVGEHSAQNAWFLITNLNEGTRKWLEPLNPEYIRMEVTEEECLQRLDHDDTRPDKAKWAEVIKQWFQENSEDATPSWNTKRVPRTRGSDNMKEFERRTSNWEAGSEAIITGYAVVFDQRTVLYKDPDTGIEYGEIIDRHALDGADMSDVVLKYNHQGRVLARTRGGSLQLSVDNHGLKIQADMSKSDEAMGFYKDVRNGLLDKMSFAFQVKEESYDRTTNTRRILAISCLRDVSLVDFPAYDQTQVSARRLFEVFAEPDRTAYHVAQVSYVHAEMRTRIEAMGFRDEESAEDYAADVKSGMTYLGGIPWIQYTPEDVIDPLKHQILQIRDKMQSQNGSADLTGALELRSQLEDLEQQLKNRLQQRAKIRAEIASGGGKPWNENTTNTKENNMTTESRAFFEKVIETRAAGTTNTMTSVIPATVMQQYVVEKAPGAFLAAAKITGIAHNGNLTLPIASLQTVERHPENEEIADAGYVPGKITISHQEYCYKTGYSDLGVQIGAENLERIIRDTILASMLKKMDGICLDAVAALEYAEGTNAVELAAAPGYADFVQLAGYLGSDFLDSAKWYMSPSTYFSWLAGLKDDQKRPILDTSKLVSAQAFCGYGIELDSQIPANTVYFGDAGRVHLNYARQPELNAWTDHDHNTQKFSVRTVAGAAAEPGCMVKMTLNG